METKKCTKCGESKPVSNFQNIRRNRDGLHTQCNACVSENVANYLARKYNAIPRGKQSQIQARKKAGVKQCNECHEHKGFSHFHKSEASPDGHGYTCKPCLSQARKQLAQAQKATTAAKTQLPNGYAARQQQQQEIKQFVAQIKQSIANLPLGIQQKPVVYVSLPIGYGRLPNVDQLALAQKRAQAAANQINAMGYRAVTPFTIGAPNTQNYQRILNYCLAYMQATRPILFFMDGWKQSYGCKNEWFLSQDMGLPTEMEQTNGMYYLQQRAEMLGIHPKFALAQ